MNETSTRSFRVISSTLIAPQDRGAILAAIADFKTAGQARANANNAGFAIQTIDPQGRVLSLKWKGIEVALLYHREVSVLNILPKDALPTIHVKSTEDEWMVVNLIQPAYQDQIAALQRRVCNLEDDKARINAQLTAKTSEAEQAGYAISALQKQNELLLEENGNYKAAFQQHKATGKGILIKYKVRPNPDKTVKIKRKSPIQVKSVAKAKKKAVSKGRA